MAEAEEIKQKGGVVRHYKLIGPVDPELLHADGTINREKLQAQLPSHLTLFGTIRYRCDTCQALFDIRAPLTQLICDVCKLEADYCSVCRGKPCPWCEILRHCDVCGKQLPDRKDLTTIECLSCHLPYQYCVGCEEEANECPLCELTVDENDDEDDKETGTIPNVDSKTN